MVVLELGQSAQICIGRRHFGDRTCGGTHCIIIGSARQEIEVRSVQNSTMNLNTIKYNAIVV